MESDLRAAPTIVDAGSGVSWAAVAAGAVGTAALTLLLVAFGAGLGLSAISPWSDAGVSPSTFKLGTGIYLIIVAVMSSAVGGYLAGRLRTKWIGAHSNEVFFRDTAHGFLAWAFATLISATALASTTAYLANGAATGTSTAAIHSSNPSEIYIDKLFRSVPVTSAAQSPTANPTSTSDGATPATAPTLANSRSLGQSRAEIMRLWSADLGSKTGISPADKTYVAQVVAAQTGLSQADAERRVEAVTAEAKTAADNARRNAAHLSFWLTAALLCGALSASLAAVEGGTLRDGTWHDRVLTPRTT